MDRSDRTSPISPNAKFARVDQGVDYSQAEPYTAIGSGTVTAITHGFAGGTGQAVYVKLDTPVVVNGRAYKQFYFAETSPLVHVGDRVAAGQPIASGGDAELGWARGDSPAGKLVGGLGAGTKATQAGQDFFDFVNGSSPAASPSAPSSADASTPATGAAPVPASMVAPPLAGADENFGVTSDPSSAQPVQPPPGSGIYSTDSFLSDMWDRIASQPGASPDAQLLASNAQTLAGG